MDELLSDFVTDTAESLEIVEADLLRLAARPGDAAPIDAALRHLHDVKGACSFLALPRLMILTEAAETFLIAVRGAGACPSPAQTDAALRCLDRMRGVLAGVAAGDAEPAGDDSALTGEMQTILQDGAAGAAVFARSPASPAPRMLRIDAEALDALADMAGELARARESLAVITAALGVDGVHAPLDALSRTAGDLIALADHLRKRRAGESWRALPRIAREAAGALGKEIEIVFTGEATDLDAHIAEAIKAPLAHLTRNAVAHGVETPGERLARGKPRAGRLTISARIEKDGDTTIEIADDGAGLDPAHIRRRGVENGMISAAQAARLTDQDAIALLFAPGFSTAPRVTAVAGRGIGLDAVKAAVEKLGGRLELRSSPGAGATFLLRLPGRAEPAPRMIIDPNEPAHERMKPLLSAAGYDIEHGQAAALPNPPQATPSKEQSA